MRSTDEHKDSKTANELHLLSEVAQDPDVSQRVLSQRIGIALGLTNLLLRNLAGKGFIKVSQAGWKRRLYTLTPAGFSHRFKLMLNYVNRFLDNYGEIRAMMRNELEPLALNEESRIAIYGTGEFAELVFLAMKEIGIYDVDIFESGESGGRRFLGMPVQNLDAIRSEDYDAIVVARLQDSNEAMQELQSSSVDQSKLVTFFSGHRNGRDG